MFLVASTLLGAAAAAETSDARIRRPLLGWPVLELRGGLQGVANGANAMICGEVSPWTYLSIEACGSGAGFLYPGDTTEVVHFRTEANIPLLQRSRFGAVLQPGLGFAEVEHGGDAPGFLFGRARSADQQEGAGPEASLSLKARWWPLARVYVSAEAGVAAAHVPSAPVVLAQDGPFVVSAITTIGLGF